MLPGRVSGFERTMGVRRKVRTRKMNSSSDRLRTKEQVSRWKNKDESSIILRCCIKRE